MIPFNPHPSNAPAYRNYPVKWSSLTHLVQSRRNSTTELARNANHRRSQSTSALPTGIVSDHKRRDSVGYEERCSRKSSLSSLVELKRYLPAIVQKSIPSSNMGQASQSGGKRDPQRYDQSAKQRIKRVKEVPCPTETSVSHRFEKQARKSSISHCPTIQNSNVSTLSKSIGNEPVHKYNRPTLPKPLLSSKEEEIKLVHRQIQAVQSLDQELRRVTGVSPEFVTEGQPVDLVDCDRTREEAVSATTPSTSSKAQKVVEITKETDSGSPKIPHLPSGATSTAQHAFNTAKSSKKETIVQLIFESRFSPSAFTSTDQSTRQDTEYSLKVRDNIQAAVESLEQSINSLENYCEIRAIPSCVQFKESSFTQNKTVSDKKSIKKANRKKRKRETEEDANSSETSLYVRRHTLPDMTVATYGMVICGTDDLHHRYRGRIEKVKFGVPISEAFSHDIPATLLVLLLKVNKEGPLKKDIWRAPGNQAQVRKLSHIMQHGRLVNISHISVYTAASVIKKFLSKLPGGVFGAENEQLLFSMMQQPDSEQQRQIFCRAISSLSIPSQHLLVLLFGTFRIIADSAETFNTRMSSDAIGISVAPSLFHTCIHDGQRAKLEDVMRFKLASQVISVIIKSFGFTNLFPRECYEFYARITGRTLHVGDDWNFTFQYPSRTFSQPEIYPSREDEKDDEEEETDDQPGPSGLQKATAREHHTDPAITEAEVTDVEEEDLYSECLPAYQSILHSARGRASSSGGQRWSKQELGSFADLKEQQRLSYSMGEVMLSRPDDEYEIERRRLCLTTLRSGNDSVESTRSLTYLEWVHEKQTKRMRTRSEWFLSPVMPQKNNGNSKSVEFKANKYIVETTMTRDISPMTLKIPEIEMNRQSSNEEMRTVSSLTSSQSPSSSVEQQQPSPMPIDSGTEEQSEKDDTVVPLNISSTGETTPRLPFQMIQHQSGDDDDTPIVATPPARQHPPMFFAGELETGLKIKPQHSSSSSSSNHSQTSVVHSSPTPKRSGLNRVSSMGVVRRKSWRKHYVRPNKSLDQEGSPKEPEPGRTSQSTPIRYPSSNSVRRPSDPDQAETSVLTRRKSSGSNSKAKAPIQTRKSTHL